MLKASQLGRYWRTVRYLRPVQIYGRVLFRLTRPRVEEGASPPSRVKTGVWQVPARRAPSMIEPRTFRFLNVPGDLDALGWRSASHDKLWLYNLHYFDDLTASGAGDRAHWHQGVLADWLVHNPPGTGDGWEPYPTSLRIVNWVKWALAGNTLSPDALNSLAVQARWLRRRLEWHLLGNHLFVNAKALVFAGLFFDGPEAQSWLAEGLRILSREMPEQILSDGGQFELSPMYHALALEDVLDLINISRCFPAASTDFSGQSTAWENLVAPMRAWLQALSHPDGQIAFFNDAAMGVAPSPAELEAYATALGFSSPGAPAPLTVLASSGYGRLTQGSAVLIADVGNVGPDYLPGHAHADTLSFELSLNGRRLVVNSGTSVYGLGAERLRQRGSQAHSTLVLDETDSSEVWGGFRVGRRARIRDRRAAETARGLMLEAAHDGYRHLPGRPVHRRRWELAGHALEITDRVEGAQSHAAAIMLHIGPGVTLIDQGGGVFTARDADGGQDLASIAIGPHARATVEASSWHPEFGLSQPTVRLAIQCAGIAPFEHTTTISWSVA